MTPTNLVRIPAVFSSLLIALFLLADLSPAAAQNRTNEKVGVMILSHGSRDQQWNQSVREAAVSYLDGYTVEFAYGMANPHNMQAAINKLEAQNVDRIVAVQLFVSSYSPIIRQNEYLLGIREKLADKPMVMMNMNGDGGMTMKRPDTLAQLDINVPVHLTRPLDDHKLVAEILMERIEALSDDPTEESILIAAHGPVADDDNRNWIASIESLGAQIQEMQAAKGKKPFKEIIPVSLRDDASKEVYNKAKMTFRNHVQRADEDGEAIVIPLLLSKGGVESRYLTRLEGLNYTWAGETLLPHDNIGIFIRESVENALTNNPS